MQPRPTNNSKPAGQNQNKQEKKASKDTKALNNQPQQKGFLGAIFGALSFKGKNQMHLPEDKQPEIVWDPKKGQWVNTAGGEEEDSGPKGPPPKDSELSGSGGPPQLASSVPQSSMPQIPQHNQNPTSFGAPVNPPSFGAPVNPPNSLPINQNSMQNNPLQQQHKPQLGGMKNGAIPNSLPQPNIGGQPNKYKQAKGIGELRIKASN
jgi:hypothetical protein